MLKIMLADDHPSMQSIYSMVMEKWNRFEYSVCKSPDECIRKIDSGFKPDIALLDYEMKDFYMNGLDVYYHIRERGLETRVIIVSAFEHIRDEVLSAGAEYQVKPFEFHDFFDNL